MKSGKISRDAIDKTVFAPFQIRSKTAFLQLAAAADEERGKKVNALRDTVHTAAHMRTYA